MQRPLFCGTNFRKEFRIEQFLTGRIHKIIRGKHIINARSVGKPKYGDPRATYIIISFGDKVEVEIRKLEYYFEAAAKSIERSDLPDEFAEMIRRGGD